MAGNLWLEIFDGTNFRKFRRSHDPFENKNINTYNVTFLRYKFDGARFITNEAIESNSSDYKEVYCSSTLEIYCILMNIIVLRKHQMLSLKSLLIRSLIQGLQSMQKQICCIL